MLSALMLTAGAMTSCDKNDDEPSTSDPQISVTPDTATYATGETTEVKFAVTSNTKWDVKSDVAGVSFSPASGNGNATVTATVSPEVTAAIINVTFTAYGKLGDITLTEPCNVTITAGDLEGTLATISEPGDYSVEDVWVVQNTTDSFVITDRTGAFMYVYLGSGKGTEYTPGTGLNVSGKVEERNSFLQFGTATTVTKNGNTHEVVLPEPEVLAGKAFENVPAKKFSYIQFTGTLVKSGTYNNVNVEGSSRKGSPLYIFSSYGDVVVADCYDTTVTVTGFVTGLPGGYVQVVVTAIEQDPDAIILKPNPATLTFEASSTEKQTVTVTKKNVTYIKAEITEGAEYFKCSLPSPMVSSIDVTPLSANSGAARTGTLTISAMSSMAGGEVIATTTVSLTQLGTVATTYNEVKTVAAMKAGTYLVGGYATSYNGSDWSANPYHMWTGAISNGDLVTVTYSFTGGDLATSSDTKANPVNFVAVSGTENGYYIVYGGQYLYSKELDTNRKLDLGTKANADSNNAGVWVATEREGKEGIFFVATTGSNTSITIGTAGAASNLIRSYRGGGQSLTAGLFLFEQTN